MGHTQRGHSVTQGWSSGPSRGGKAQESPPRARRERSRPREEQRGPAAPGER